MKSPSDILIIPGFLCAEQRLKDGTRKISIETQELNPEQVIKLDQSFQKFGYWAFKEEPFRKDEMSALDGLEADLDDGKKSQGQRIRGVLYLLWQKDKEGYEDFNLYYRFKTEKYISYLKKLLDD